MDFGQAKGVIFFQPFGLEVLYALYFLFSSPLSLQDKCPGNGILVILYSFGGLIKEGETHNIITNKVMISMNR